MKPILEIQHVSKKFQIRHEGPAYLSFRERISGIFKASSKSEDFWALNDVSFNVEAGESVGIIGRNGAGKSTLLKILSRITPPTQGRIVSRGRIASLLEVGTGFHQELTGRENVYMNGSILGMKKREIDAQFDAIVDFSGTERFLDTPLKHYSSGMQLRLAFAVAAHLEPEILVIDEVLAVGDAEFQKKCLDKMAEVTKTGRTILFVSHNIGAVRSLCQRTVLLEGGTVRSSGPSRAVTDLYLSSYARQEESIEFARPVTNIPGYVRKISIHDRDGKPLSRIPLFAPFTIRAAIAVLEPIKHFVLGIGMTTIDDAPVRTIWSTPQDMAVGDYEVTFDEDTVFFATGKYKLILGLSSRNETFQYLPDAMIVEFEEMSDKQKIVNTYSGVILNSMHSKIVKK